MGRDLRIGGSGILLRLERRGRLDLLRLRGLELLGVAHHALLRERGQHVHAEVELHELVPEEQAHLDHFLVTAAEAAGRGGDQLEALRLANRRLVVRQGAVLDVAEIEDRVDLRAAPADLLGHDDRVQHLLGAVADDEHAAVLHDGERDRVPLADRAGADDAGRTGGQGLDAADRLRARAAEAAEHEDEAGEGDELLQDAGLLHGFLLLVACRGGFLHKQQTISYI